jgi:hypothetical protein
MSGWYDGEDRPRRAPTDPIGVDKWRVGRAVPLNVYDGDRPVCQCHSTHDAMMIVTAVNQMFDGVRMGVSQPFVLPADKGFGTFPITKEGQ